MYFQDILFMFLEKKYISIFTVVCGGIDPLDPSPLVNPLLYIIIYKLNNAKLSKS